MIWRQRPGSVTIVDPGRQGGPGRNSSQDHRGYGLGTRDLRSHGERNRRILEAGRIRRIDHRSIIHRGNIDNQSGRGIPAIRRRRLDAEFDGSVEIGRRRDREPLQISGDKRPGTVPIVNARRKDGTFRNSGNRNRGHFFQTGNVDVDIQDDCLILETGRIPRRDYRVVGDGADFDRKEGLAGAAVR